MKFRIKLLKAWEDAAGNKFAAGDVIEIEEKDVYADLIIEGIGEKAAENTEPEIDVDAAVAKAIEPLVAEVKAVKGQIETHEKSDDDPSRGYCAPTAGREWTTDEKFHGLGEFAKDVFESVTSGGKRPARLEKALDESRRVVAKGIESGAITKASGDLQQVGVDSDGGFLVPPEFSLMLNESSIAASVVRPRATVIQTGSNVIKLPQPRNYDHSSNLIHGGIQAYWKGEDDQLTESKVQWEEVQIPLHALTAMAKVTHEMLRFSSVSVGSYILPKLADGIAWKEDDGFINGTGAGMPLGLINAYGIVSQAIETGQDLTPAFVSANATKMYQRLKIERTTRRTCSRTWLWQRSTSAPVVLRLV
jgi:HK97 family phage major capsid protein